MSGILSPTPQKILRPGYENLHRGDIRFSIQNISKFYNKLSIKREEYALKLYDLMTDKRRENILVGSKKPVFSWRVETEKRNVRQESYRVQVWDEQGNSVWDSGTVEASRMAGIQYEGKELQSKKNDLACKLYIFQR